MHTICLYLWNDHLLLLQRRADYRSGGGGTFCLPGGQSEPHELPEMTIQREVAEEAGLMVLGKADHLGVLGKDSEGTDIRAFAYKDNRDSDRPPTVTLSHEHQGCVWIKAGEDWFLSLPTAGPVTENIVKAWAANWTWPIKDATPLFPDAPGMFGTTRKHDVHTGIDLYCEEDAEIVAVEPGVVVAVEKFTGEWCEGEDHSPWWNNTAAVLVRGDSGVVLYGEIQSTVSVGDTVERGQGLGWARTVLRKFKGRPMTMLHLELLDHNAVGSVWWHEGEQPDKLKNPLTHLLIAAIRNGGVHHFNLDDYDGTSFRPSQIVDPNTRETAPCPICEDVVWYVHDGGDAFNATGPTPEGTVTLACRCSVPREQWEQALREARGILDHRASVRAGVRPLPR